MFLPVFHEFMDVKSLLVFVILPALGTVHHPVFQWLPLLLRVADAAAPRVDPGGPAIFCHLNHGFRQIMIIIGVVSENPNKIVNLEISKTNALLPN